jgi:folate-binding protein YgfZ
VTPPHDAIDPAARDTVVVDGPGAAAFLQSQISQDITALDVGASTWTLVLAPTGKVDSLARIVRAGDDRFELQTDAGFGGVLLARLDRFKIRVDATTMLVPAERSEPSADHEHARIAAGWPRMGREIVPGETIPAATGVVDVAVSFTKGCYPGQELVERMDSRGAVAPSSLRVVDVPAGASVGETALDADGHEVGAITSVSPRGGVAIVRVKRGS